MQVLIEIFFTKIVRGNVLYEKHIAPFLGGKDPDLEVMRIWRDKYRDSKDQSQENCVIHSTSWRYETNDRLILTYIFYSEQLNFINCNFRAIPFSKMQFPHDSQHEILPNECDEEESILAHGFRHIGLLIKFNTEYYKAKFSPANFKRLKGQSVIGVAGRIN